MPMIGAAVTRAMADDAKSHLAAVTSDLRGVAREARRNGVPIRSRDINLAPLSVAQVQRAWDLIVPNRVWRPDDACGQRAMTAAHEINRDLGAGVTGIDDVAAAAVGVQPRGLRGGVGAHGGYAYHGYPLVKIEHHDELWALDPRNFTAPVPLSTMVAHIHGKAPTEIWSPIQNYGWEHPTYLPGIRRHSVPVLFDTYAKYLSDSWDQAARIGRVVPRPGERLDGPAGDAGTAWAELVSAQ